MRTALVAAAALLLAATDAADELKVTVYDGPTECADEDKVVAGKSLGMHYTGTIDKSSTTGVPGKKFDSSRDRGQVFQTKIGVGQVIKGWDEGLIGMCKGAKATLVIPPEMGYGAQGAGGDIPGGATLNFDVEVMSVADAPPEPNLFAELDTDGDAKLTKEEVLAHFKKQGATSCPMASGSRRTRIRTVSSAGRSSPGPRARMIPRTSSERRNTCLCDIITSCSTSS